MNGAPLAIPHGIGVVTPAVTQTTHCPFAQAIRYYWVHTHADDGIIHVESPAQRQYTPGALLDIWRQPLSGQRVAAATVTAYVNGVRYTRRPSRDRPGRTRGHPARRGNSDHLPRAGGLVDVTALAFRLARSPLFGRPRPARALRCQGAATPA